MNPPMPDNNNCPQCGTPLPFGALAGLCPACLLKMGAAADTVTDAKQKAFVPPSVAELAAKFPQLEILELVGKGGMGAVYKARQKQLDRIVALKILPPGIGDEPAFAERFAREAKALAKLNHPNIVTLYEFGDAGGQFYFLMEFVDGLNLRQLLAGSRIAPREALAIVPQICDALQFAHDQGIVHRDIKPENILLDRRGRVKVADFGLAKIIESRDDAADFSTPGKISENLTDAGKAMGTPNYMSPEQIQAPGEVDHRADIYALGVVFYQMLTGELPGKRLLPPSSKVQIDVRLDEIVLRALEQKPALRYQQVSEVKTMVESLSAETNQAKEQKPNEPIESRCSRTAIVGAIGVPLSFIPIVWFVALVKQSAATPATHDTSVFNVILLIMGFMGLVLATPVVTSMLGWVAVAQIRRSAGRLTGLKLAVFDGLFFPVLLLDAMIGGVGVFLDKLLDVYVRHLDGSLFVNLGDFALWLCLMLGIIVWVDIAFIRAVWRGVNKGAASAAPNAVPPAPLATPRQPAASPKSSRFASWLISPLSSPEVREIAAHLTPEERNEAALHGLLWGLWVVTVTFGNLWLIRSFPAPGCWIVAAIITLLFLASLPTWFRMQRRFLYSTAWARAQGYDAASIKLFAFSRTNLWRVLAFAGAGILLIVGQSKLFTHLSGVDELSQSLKEDAARTQEQMARLAAQKKTPSLAFGPVVECVVPDSTREHGFALNFTMGKLLTPPSDVSLHMLSEGVAFDTDPMNWARKYGGDLVAMPDGGVRFIEGVVARQTDEAHLMTWDEFTPQQVLADMSRLLKNPAVRLDGGWPQYYTVSDRAPLAMAFMTRNHQQGVLQILGNSDNPPGVKIRYQLVQPSASLVEKMLAKRAARDEFQCRWVAAEDDTNSPAALLPDTSQTSGQPPLRVLRDVILSSDDVESAGFSNYQSDPKILELYFTSRGREKFAQATAQNIGRRLAVVWRGKVIVAPNVQAEIASSRGEIPVRLSDIEAQQLLDWLNHRQPMEQTNRVSSSISEPADLREARAKLAELRVDYADSNPVIQRMLARIKELERMTKEEPDAPADLREAKAHLAELRVDYTEQNPRVQEALARIKVLEQNGYGPKYVAMIAVQGWLALVDAGAFGQSWETAADSFRDAMTKDDWTKRLEQVRPPLGSVSSRQLISTHSASVLPGMPDGSYFIAQFETAFAAEMHAVETVTFGSEKDGQWKAVAYLIRPRTAEQTAAVTAAQKWLAEIDAGNYAASWTGASEYFQGAIAQDKWISAMESVRKPLGELKIRTVDSAVTETQMPGSPDGKYVVMQFNAAFANKNSATETVTFLLEANGKWKACGYYIK